ncbi:YgjV family protein [Pseudomonas sp. RSB 5.4]|uniref:YgjV family protein n=1 Tax=Pseudomonas sp. RSB 5.4 TaxID=3127459 RepID=UPI0030D1DE7C
MAYLDWIQWPAMVVTVLAAWLIGSQRPRRWMIGFVCFSVSNVLWVIWGFYAGAYALIVLQVCLFLMNLRGLKKNSKGKENEHSQDGR